MTLLALTALPMAFSVIADDKAAPESGSNIEFDVRLMESRGVDPKVADSFRQAAHFNLGETTVSLTVNGDSRGRVKVRFDNDGNLCADEAFQKKAGLLPPPGFSEKAACFDLTTGWAQTELSLEPGEERVDVVVPPQAVAPPGADSGNWEHGGFAGLLNYDAQYMDSSGSSGGVNFAQLATEAGFNIDDWIVRSRQTFSRFNSDNLMRHQGAYAQRSFMDIKKVLQVGQISLSNSMFGTGQVLGFQLFPENALVGGRNGAGLVEGIADTQSVIEVRQSGVLVYSTTVPAGPFRLQGFSLLNTRTDLAVTVTGSNGEARQFTVPAAALLQNGAAVEPGLSFGVGKLTQQGSSESPLIGTMATGWLLDAKTTLNAGILASTPYRAGAVGLDTQLFDATSLLVQTTVAEDGKHGDNGVSATASLSQQLVERISVNVNASQQTQGYRELSDALQSDITDSKDRSRNQYGAGLGWAVENVGNLSFSWARSTTFRGDSVDYMRGGWSQTFGRVYVGASLEHNTGSTTTEAENRLYVTVNIPFGGRSVSSYINSANRSTRGGIRYSDRTSQDRGWSLSSEHDFRNNRTSNSGNFDRVTSVSQLSGSLSHDSDNYTTWSGRATGGIVLHNKGITLSPYNVSDTFGIAKVGEEAGIRLETPGGPTWTNSRGYAVIPSLSSYKRSSIQVDTRSLPKNVDIDNAVQETEAARGSVNYLNFGVVTTRRVLVDVNNAQGQSLQQGLSVFDVEGNFITVIGEKGQMFVPDASAHMKLEVQSSGMKLCSITLALPEKADASGLYETASAVCR